MKLADAKKLVQGNIVFWNDPDQGIFSRSFVIQSVEVEDDGVVHIEGVDGDWVHAYPHELDFIVGHISFDDFLKITRGDMEYPE